MLLSKAMGRENQETISVLLLNVYYFSDYLLRMQGLWDFVNDDYGNIIRNVKKLAMAGMGIKEETGQVLWTPSLHLCLKANHEPYWNPATYLPQNAYVTHSTLFLCLSWINSAFVMVIRRSDIIWCCHFLNSFIVFKTNWQHMSVLKY